MGRSLQPAYEAASTESREAQLVEAIYVRIREIVPDPHRDSDPELLEGLKATIAASVREGFSRRQERPKGPSPEAIRQARLAARAGMPLAAVLRSYVAGYLELWRLTSTQLGGLGIDEVARARSRKAVSASQVRYFDQILSGIAAQYADELACNAQAREHRRSRAVRELLDGDTDSAEDLGYEINGAHIGLIASGSEVVDAIRRLAEAFDRRALTVVRGDLVWAWLGGREPIQPVEYARLSQVRPGQDIVIAFGEQMSGPHGFRVTHRQAVAAYRVGARRAGSSVRYAEVSLLAVALENESTARSIIQTQLGPLGTGKRAVQMRQTLRAYFRAGQNASSAAALLGLDRRTVGYRLRAIEQQLGATIASRHADLEIALELEELVAHGVSSSDRSAYE